MEKKTEMDRFGALSLIGFAILLAFNQVVIKVTNEGFQPVFFAGLRSAGAIVVVALWLRYRGLSLTVPRDVLPFAVLIGVAFAVEFIFLFIALDLTTVARTSVLFYTMPVWLALLAHFFIPGEALTPLKGAGLALAVAGVVVAFAGRQGGPASLAGDLLSIAGAMSWASLAFLAKGTRLRTLRPEVQLFWQVLVSAPILLAAAPLFGDLIRDVQAIHLWGLAFQVFIVVGAGFIFWLWLLSIYPAASVASFSFLTPVFGVGLGWLLLDEAVGAELLVALALVAAGLFLINRQVPQKVRETRSSGAGGAV